METYRIIQTADNAFMVEILRRKPREGFWPWVKRQWIEEWQSIHFRNAFCPITPPFPTEAAAQKWIDDKRTYPIVVKQPA